MQYSPELEQPWTAEAPTRGRAQRRASERSADALRRVLYRIHRPTAFSLIFVLCAWAGVRVLLTRKMDDPAGASELIGFFETAATAMLVFYAISILAKLLLGLSDIKQSRRLLAVWCMFGVALSFALLHFTGYAEAARSLICLLQGQEEQSAEAMGVVMREYWLLPSAPIVYPVLAVVLPPGLQPSIPAVDLRLILCALVGLSIGGFYSYYWRLVPRYLAGLMILLGVAGTVVLILFLALPGVPFQGDEGRLIVRMGVTTLVVLSVLAVYGEAWKRVCVSLCNREGPEPVDEQADPGEEEGREALARGILPPAQVETGFWLFLGFMLVADLLSATT